MNESGNEWPGIGQRRTLNCLLRRYLRELLRDQVVVLSELLQQLVARGDCRVDLFRVDLLLGPRARPLSRAVRQTVEYIQARRLVCQQLLGGQLMSQKLLDGVLGITLGRVQ